MARFQYSARDVNGNKTEGLIDAPSSIAVVTRLRNQNLLPVEVKPAGQTEKNVSLDEARYSSRKKRISLKELAVFTRQASAMLDAGVSIIELLDDLASQTSNRYFAFVLRGIRKDIQEGNNFSKALSKYPKIFSNLYIALISSGEESGNLAEVMAQLSKNLEDQIALISKVRQAVSYPAVVTVFFIGVVSFVFLFLLPRFQEIFQDFGAELPVFTVVILAISRFLVSMLPFILAGIILFIAFLFILNKTPKGKELIDTAKLRFPLFGQLMLKISLSRLASSLATLLAGGVTIVAALEIVSKTAGNSVVEKSVMKVREGVIKGSLVGGEMKKYRIFPVLFVRMVTVGEETGKVDDMLNRVAKFFRDEVDATLNVLASILEPFLIISLGAIVGIVVLAIYLPIFNLASAIR